MDQKSWLWPRKRPSEKIIVSFSKSDHLAQGNGVEGQTAPNEKEIFMEQSLKILDEKLATALSESNSKDEQLIRSAEMEQAAIAGQRKAEAEVLSLKKELNEAVNEREAANERIMHLNTALRDHMQQLASLREEQEQKICDSVMRTSKEFEKSHKKLEEKLTETSKRITILTHENSHLNKVLLVKGKIIEDLTKSSTCAEAEFNALMSRLDSVEKENSFLRYEFQMLEREFHIRNEEVEFSRRSLDASHKQQLENVKKIKKLEADCQRLRLLTRKRLPGPVALTKVKNEIDLQEQNQAVIRRRKSNPPSGSLTIKDTAPESHPDILRKEISFLVERLCNLEGENRALKDLLARKEIEICHCGRVDGNHVGLFSPVKCSKELALASPLSNETSSISSYDTIKSKMIGVSEMSLMDDFVEMEKLAIVAVDSKIGSSYPPSDASLTLSDSSRIETHGNHLDSAGKELVLVGQGDLNEPTSKRSSNWLHEILKIIMEQSRVSRKGIDELMEDIRVAFYSVNPPVKSEHSGPPELLPISGYITWNSPKTSPRPGGLVVGTPDIGSSVDERGKGSIKSNLSQSVCRFIELVRRLDPVCQHGSNSFEMDKINIPCQRSTMGADHFLCVFRWRSFELKNALQLFFITCTNLLDEKIHFDQFFAELTSVLDWLINNCVSFRPDSSVRDILVNHLGQNGSRITTEPGSMENFVFELEKIHSILQAENEGLRAEINSIKSSNKDIQVKLQVVRNESENLASELQQSQKSIERLQADLETAKESKRMMEDLLENQKSINEDLDTQLNMTKVKLNETLSKLSSLEVELEDRSHCCEELEGTCLELQLQLESITATNTSVDNVDQEKGLQQTGWEITAASAKLAECQETILNLGKQIKALALPTGNTVDDASCSNKNMKKHMSLLDRMLSEDDVEKENLNSPYSEEPPRTIDTILPTQSPQCEAKTPNMGTLVLFPSKKRGGMSFLRKLLLRKKREKSKKKAFSLGIETF